MWPRIRTRPARVVAGAVAAAGYAGARHRFLHWGADQSEVDAPLPGDDLIASPTMQTTRAITIDAPPEAVWPWLIQMGQDRAGLYSYSWLENLFGLHFRNASRIVAEWQRLEVGDQMRAGPERAGPEAGFTVVAIERYRSIVTVVGDPARVLPLAKAGRLPEGATWVFVLSPLAGNRTRLVVRLRARFGLPGPGAWLGTRLLEPVHFLMEREQLLGISRRAAAV